VGDEDAALGYTPIKGRCRIIMKFCSACGGKVTLQRPTPHDRERYVCTACGITHYENPRIIVCCSVSWNGKALLCRRAEEPAVGKWSVPTGFLECGETLEEGAARETFEETGVVLDPGQLELHGVVNVVDMKQVYVGFRIDLATKPVLCPGPECLEVAFLGEEDIQPDELAWYASMDTAMKRWFDELRMRDYTIRLGTLRSSRRQDREFREYRIESVNKT